MPLPPFLRFKSVTGRPCAVSAAHVVEVVKVPTVGWEAGVTLSYELAEILKDAYQVVYHGGRFVFVTEETALMILDALEALTLEDGDQWRLAEGEEA